MSRPRRVVLTGLGVVSPIGLDLASFKAALAAGKSGVRRIRAFDPSGLPVQIAGEIDGFDPKVYLEKKDRKSLKMMARTVQLAVAASRLAIDDAQLRLGEIDPARFGVVFGMSTVPGELADLGPGALASYDPATDVVDIRRWGTDGMSKLPPVWMLNHVPNMATCHVSILYNAQGPNNTITQYDVAGLLALGEAVNVIHREAAELMLAGGADTRTPMIAMIRHTLFARLSRRNDEPQKACRPFDRSRDGQVTAEGGCVVVAEDLEHARRRGARVYAEVLGFAAGFDRGRSGAGLARVIGRALEAAGVGPGDLDHVSAHAPGTREDDAWEARGLCVALGEGRVPVSAVKSYTGNMGSGSSTTELAASALAMLDGWRPGTLNHEQTDPECPVAVLREPSEARRRCLLKVAATDMGQCAAMVLRVGAE